MFSVATTSSVESQTVLDNSPSIQMVDMAIQTSDLDLVKAVVSRLDLN
jgi:hypothetical protein